MTKWKVVFISVVLVVLTMSFGCVSTKPRSASFNDDPPANNVQPIGVFKITLLAEQGQLWEPIGCSNRFSMSTEGVIMDKRTGLEWLEGPNQGFSYHQAKEWTRKCNIAGGGWRMPSINELRGLYVKNTINYRPRLFKTTFSILWADSGDMSFEAVLDFSKGGWASKSFGYPVHVYAVRLSSPVQVINSSTGQPRFLASANKVITDSETGLQWVVGPDKNTSYRQALAWLEACDTGGGGWRMPTLAELKKLFAECVGTCNMDPIFETTGCFVWAEPKDSKTDWCFAFDRGNETYGVRGDQDGRAFGIRSPSTVTILKQPDLQLTTVETARDGRFIAYNNGTVLDTKTNLMWAAKDNGSNINWSNAKSYCENYRGGGYTDWRMPTQEELVGLYDAAKTYKSNCARNVNVHLTELIHLTCPWVWGSETRGSDAAFFSFIAGIRKWFRQSVDNANRALPVRSGK